MTKFQLFIFYSDDLVTFCSNLFDTPPADQTSFMLRSRLIDLNERWAKVGDIYGEAMLETEDDIDKETLQESVRSKYKSANKSYHECRSFIMEKLVPKSKPAMGLNSTLLPGVATSQNTRRGLMVAPCDMEDFEGSYEEWPTFRDLFSAIFIQNDSVSEVEKLFHLRRKTKGEASNIVKRFAVSAENFELAWEALRCRYENKRLLVDNQLKKLLNISAVSVENSSAIQKIQVTISDCLATLKAQNISVENWDPFIVYVCSTKLPEETLALWEQSLESRKDLPKWADMESFLISRFEVVERVNNIKGAKPKPSSQNSSKPSCSQNKSQGNTNANKTHSKTQSFLSNETDTGKSQNIECILCKQAHHLRVCPKFKGLSVTDRRKFVSKNKICFNCLASFHLKNKCTSTHNCSVCSRKHHSMLHKEDDNNATEKPTTSKGGKQQAHHANTSGTQSNRDYSDPNFMQSNEENTTTMYTHGTPNVLLPTAMVSVEHEGGIFVVRALIDPGSQSTFISERVQQRLSLPTMPISTSISAMGGKAVQRARKLCHLTLVSPEYKFKQDIQALVLPKLTNLLPAHTIPKPDLSCFGNLTLADPHFYRSNQIDLLLGSDYIPIIILEGLRKSTNGTFIAQNSVFGWYISGSIPVTTQTYSTLVKVSENDSLSNQLKLFWETEEIFPENLVSDDDQYCEEFFRLTTTRQLDGRYIVRLPFRKEFPKSISLGASRYVAIKQYERIERSLSKDKELQAKYGDVLNEYLAMGHMTRATSVERSDRDSYHSFYLPHHSVIKPDSVTTKVRVVFNASKRTRNGASLNEILYTGPTLQNDLMTTLLKWRTHQFVFNGDIEKMYRQILVHPNDREFQKIVFRPAPNDLVQDFRLNTVTFGVNCAPFLAIRVLHKLAEDSEDLFPIAASILKHETYVDDILSGCHDLNDAKVALDQLIVILQSAGFPLRKITANHPALLENIPPEHRLTEDFLKFESASLTKTLGIRWNASQDCFYYSVKAVEQSTSITKRQILSISASWYDPAGWITPVTIRAKILLQDMWKEGQDWDTVAKPLVMHKWNSIVAELKSVSQIKIPRWIGAYANCELQLHGFCDASERAYCACIYVRSCSPEGIIVSRLLVAKSKVAPVKTVSLPRLELCGAVLLSKLAKVVKTNLNLSFCSQYFWCDSTITLAWLQRPSYHWKTFVANRVAQITANVGDSEWRHVATNENPADLGTRDRVSISELSASVLWWEGPQWLKYNNEKWPQGVVLPSSPPEIRKVEVLHSCSNSYELLDRFSSLPFTLKVMSFVCRFYANCRKAVQNKQPDLGQRRRLGCLNISKSIKKVPDISAQEIAATKIKLIIAAQETFYAIERQSLLKGRPVPKKSSLYTLNPFLDSSLVMRVNGRLAYARWGYNERHPVIIPERSQFCTLLISFHHFLLMHAEVQLMTRFIRMEYYIPRLKNKLKACIRACLPCVRYKHNTRKQIMSALPPERVEYNPAFSVIGIDFAGPFSVKSSAVRRAPYLKGYVCVFVCFTSKAIHLEVVSALSTEAFCGAFARFVGRRGLPRKVFSDNGRNFVGASTALQKDYMLFMKDSARQLSSKSLTQGVEWSFIPPNAPHMGGLWEAAVKSFKSHLTKTAGSHRFTYEEFSTLLVRIEAVLNSRPISALSNDPSDLLPLTPAHLVCGRSLLAIPEPCKEDVSLFNRWEKLKALHHQFSRRWKSEYLHELQKRRKWQEPQPDVQIDDLVILKEDGLPPSEWRLGRVIEIHPGRDEKVRVVTLKTSQGIYKRPIVKCVVLPKAN